MSTTEGLPLALGIWVLAISVFFHAYVVWRTRASRPSALDSLDDHNKELEALLETAPARRVVAQFVTGEVALAEYVDSVQDALRTADPEIAVEEEVKKKKNLLQRAGDGVKRVAKAPLTQTLMGKLNSYIKSRTGAS